MVVTVDGVPGEAAVEVAGMEEWMISADPSESDPSTQNTSLGLTPWQSDQRGTQYKFGKKQCFGVPR